MGYLHKVNLMFGTGLESYYLFIFYGGLLRVKRGAQHSGGAAADQLTTCVTTKLYLVNNFSFLTKLLLSKVYMQRWCMKGTKHKVYSVSPLP